MLKRISDVVVHGPAFSDATTKLRSILVYAKMPFRHEQQLKAKPQGIKPGTDYRKVPIFNWVGSQVNDSNISCHCWARLAVTTLGTRSVIK
jgi:hypothetical protein